MRENYLPSWPLSVLVDRSQLTIVKTTKSCQGKISRGKSDKSVLRTQLKFVTTIHPPLEFCRLTWLILIQNFDALLVIDCVALEI